MHFLASIFVPTGNRRLNELVGFLLCVFAFLLFLALASYSPLDPSLNSASVLTGTHAARNWIGVVGALISDLALQFFGIGSFLLPIFPAMLGLRWFASRKIQSPLAKSLGGLWLVVFVPALLALLPGNARWLRVMPIEGLLGRVVGDVLIHYLNLAGAYIVCASMLAVALYLCTAFSFSSIQLWVPTRLAFVIALWNRYLDWQEERAKKRQQKELEKRRISRPVVKTQLIPSRQTASAEPTACRPELRQSLNAPASSAHLIRNPQKQPRMLPLRPEEFCRSLWRKRDPPVDPEVTQRGDSDHKAKTTMPRIAGGYKLPSSSLLQRPNEQQAVDANELKLLAQVLTEKYAEFEVHGQITQINPGPVVTTFEFKPNAGIKYSRITNLTDDLCLALKAESILIERMAGKSTVGIQVPNREREIIWLRENIESQEFMGSKSKLTMAMGKDINGRIVTADLNGIPPPADCGVHRLRQERGHQRLHHVDSLQSDAGASAVDPGGSKAAGTRQLRRRTAPIYANHHGAKAGGERAAQRRTGNGTSLELLAAKACEILTNTIGCLITAARRACSKKIPTTNRFPTS